MQWSEAIIIGEAEQSSVFLFDNILLDASIQEACSKWLDKFVVITEACSVEKSVCNLCTELIEEDADLAELCELMLHSIPRLAILAIIHQEDHNWKEDFLETENSTVMQGTLEQRGAPKIRDIPVHSEQNWPKNAVVKCSLKLCYLLEVQN